MRDEFNRDIKETLSKRVALHCSNPQCRKLTIGPNSNENKTTNIGVAAHITAASPGGPRYDESIDTEIRSSIPNAIWLCQSCAKLIDSDIQKYPKEILLKWKQDLESETENRLNQTPKQLNEKKDRTEQPKVKWGCFVFPPDENLYCPYCYNNKGDKYLTTRVNIKNRKCTSCKSNIPAG